MPTYVVKKSGYLFGSYIAEGTEMNLHTKQAKYPVMSGQIAPVGVEAKKLDVPKKAAKGPIEPAMPPKPKKAGPKKGNVRFGGEMDFG